MTNNYLYIICTSLILAVFTRPPMMAANDDFELITYSTEDGGLIEASFFKGSQELVVIFTHGAIFNKESWYFLVKKLLKEGISSLSLDFRGYGNSKNGSTKDRSLDVLGAIDYLKEKGYNKIAIVGGSMGGAAILHALNKKTDPAIEKVVLLSPAGGVGIESKFVNKMIIVSEEEGYFTGVRRIYKESSQPKMLKVYPGSFHAQHMFKAKYSNDLTSSIISFLNALE